MNQEITKIIDEANLHMQKAVTHLTTSLAKVRGGKASPQMLLDVMVDYYGAHTPLSQLATVNTPDHKTIIVAPWDKSQIHPIEKAIMAANLGFNPQTEGEMIRINVPPLSEERRKQFVKYIHQEGENNKISIRNSRKKANEDIKAAEKKGAPEDESRKAEIKVQDMTNKYIKEIDEVLVLKEKEIMTV